MVSSLPMCGFYSEPLVVCFFGTEQRLSHILDHGGLTAVDFFLPWLLWSVTSFLLWDRTLHQRVSQFSDLRDDFLSSDAASGNLGWLNWLFVAVLVRWKAHKNACEATVVGGKPLGHMYHFKEKLMKVWHNSLDISDNLFKSYRQIKNICVICHLKKIMPKTSI